MAIGVPVWFVSVIFYITQIIPFCTLILYCQGFHPQVLPPECKQMIQIDYPQARSAF